MKLTVFQFEGTPAELDASQLLQQLVTQGEGASAGVLVSGIPAPSAGSGPGEVPGVALEGQAAVRALLRGNPAAEHFTAFLAEATAWPDVRVHGVKRHRAGSDAPLDYGDYLRVRRQGSPKGAFAYVYAHNGVVNLRLPYDTDDELLGALAPAAYRLEGGNSQYRISVQIVDEKTRDQAVRLAKVAFERT
ncbi:hypothetical protein ACIPW5_04855 [Streptomyces sp. NPDC090077]|uniref:hypothetical protein n=1 Tax=Streptomyces sp. NPDC090077 TaxID=3365938 RepID=UPI0037F48F0C